MNGLRRIATAIALVATTSACGTPAPATTTAKPPATPTSIASTSPPPAPLDCDTLCTKANTVTGCATDAANIPACVDLCKRMVEGACKAQVEAELACAAKLTLACKPEGGVDWGACVAEQRAANECAKTSLF
jgi:hypothetical protein